MKNAFTLLVVTSLLASGLLRVPQAQAGPMGRSAKMAARLKKYPTSSWLAHYLPDDRYKIAGGIWKYVSTDLDTFYHRPDSALMLRQTPGSVIGFASAQEAEDAGYRPDPNLDGFGAMDMGMGASGATRIAASQRVTLADGSSSLTLPGGWKRVPGRTTRAQFASSTLERFLGPKGERFEVATVTLNLPPSANPQLANMDVGQFLNVRFFNQIKANARGMAGNIDRLSASSGRVNSQFQGQNMVAALNQLDNLKVFRINLGGLEGVGATTSRPTVGQPRRSYTVGRGRKILSIGDFSPRANTLSGILPTVRFR